MLVEGEILKLRDLELDPKSNKSPEPLLDGPATSEHMSALLLLRTVPPNLIQRYFAKFTTMRKMKIIFL